MPSTLEEFFQRLHWEVTLPVSQLVVLLRKPDLTIFLGLRGGELPIPTAPAAPDTETDALPPPSLTVRDVNRYTERIIAEGVISPPMSDVRDDQDKPVYSKHYVHVSELEDDDRTFLAQALFKKMGLTPEVAKGIDAFRPDSLSSAGESPGGALPDVALADSQAQ